VVAVSGTQNQNILKLINKSPKEYIVAFTLNTTYGINLITNQLDTSEYRRIITSDIEHNSVFLPSIVISKNNNLERIILERESDGTIIYNKDELDKSFVLVNSTSNIDGRNLKNAQQFADDIHSQGGILLLDACQTFGHHPEMLADVDFDAAFGSGHKMYGPSVGFIVIKKSLFKKLNPFIIGGGTVESVTEDTYTLVSNKDELFSHLEPGLQNYAGIVGLNAAIEWRHQFKKDGKTAHEYETYLGQYLFERISSVKGINILNSGPSSAVSFIPEKMSGHQLGIYLGQGGIMARSGYHCCHYYLHEKLKLDPTLRISLGLHNTDLQIDETVDRINAILN
jgi:cysteine desulfurase/selenocysteine lyase